MSEFPVTAVKAAFERYMRWDDFDNDGMTYSMVEAMFRAGLENGLNDYMLTAIGMVIGQGDGEAFMRAYSEMVERKKAGDPEWDKPTSDPCPICGFALRCDSFSVFMVPEELVRKYAVKRKYVDPDKPPRFGWAMHQMCAFMCYRQEYDQARRSSNVV